MLRSDQFSVQEPPDGSPERLLCFARLTADGYSVEQGTIGRVHPSGEQALHVDWLTLASAGDRHVSDCVDRAHLEEIGSLVIKLDSI